jgi:hypothetical protein
MFLSSVLTELASEEQNGEERKRKRKREDETIIRKTEAER